MNDAIEKALSSDRVVDITTTGRRTGAARRIEIWMFQVDGGLYISGRPGKRGWYANLLADPRLTLHLKQAVRADLPAKARPVTDTADRERIFTQIQQHFGADFEDLVAASPLVAIHVD